VERNIKMRTVGEKKNINITTKKIQEENVNIRTNTLRKLTIKRVRVRKNIKYRW
jgi:hypothetical protein